MSGPFPATCKRRRKDDVTGWRCPGHGCSIPGSQFGRAYLLRSPLGGGQQPWQRPGGTAAVRFVAHRSDDSPDGDSRLCQCPRGDREGISAAGKAQPGAGGPPLTGACRGSAPWTGAKQPTVERRGGNATRSLTCAWSVICIACRAATAAAIPASVRTPRTRRAVAADPASRLQHLHRTVRRLPGRRALAIDGLHPAEFARVRYIDYD